VTEQSVRDQIVQLEAEIAGLTARLPRHSVPPTMLLHLEELEDMLATLRSRVAEAPPASPGK